MIGSRIRLYIVLASTFLIQAFAPLTSRGDDGEPICVFLVHGTWGGSGEWNRPIPDFATFYSEMLRALPTGSKIHTMRFDSSNQHSKRMEAASELSRRIDRESLEMKRVCLIGHSHGGNICLAAAGLCTPKIQTVISIGTPHCYGLFERRELPGILRLPIYCSHETRVNCTNIVSVTSSADKVASFYAGILPGITENEALFRTETWQKVAGYPAVLNDGPIEKLLGVGNVDVQADLVFPDIAPAINVTWYPSFRDTIGVKSHHIVHSPRCGYLLGIVLRENCSAESIEYLQSFIPHPENRHGDPIALTEYRSWLQSNSSNLAFSGWVLSSMEIELIEEARQSEIPSPYVEVLNENGALSVRSEYATETQRVELEIGAFIPRGKRHKIEVRDRSFFTSRTLGAVVIEAGDEVPTRIYADASSGRFWNAKLEWQWVHY